MWSNALFYLNQCQWRALEGADYLSQSWPTSGLEEIVFLGARGLQQEKESSQMNTQLGKSKPTNSHHQWQIKVKDKNPPNYELYGGNNQGDLWWLKINMCFLPQFFFPDFIYFRER